MRLLEEIQQQDSVHYHLLFIHPCVRLRALESALQLFDASLQRGVQLNVITYATLISGGGRL